MNLKFDSIILAGGFGKRLSPLTDTTPKPMLPVFGESALERNLRLIREQGFMNTAVTTMYLPEKVESVKTQTGYIEFFREKEPLGSAGAVGALKEKLDDCVLVLSGDAIFDFDLREAKREFLESGCNGGMILTHRNDSGEYGSICLDNGKVTCISEKPSPRDTLSDLINTGIYFFDRKAFELIPENKFFDFAKDLFPLMFKQELPIKGIVPKGIWFDIGSFGEYHQCNLWVSKGQNCIGDHVSIHTDAKIESSVIFERCTIGNSTIRGCIIGENTVIGNDCILPPGCVVGANSEIRDNAVLAPGSIVSCGETVVGKALVENFPKQKQSLILDDDFIIAQEEDEGYFVRLGRLLGGEGPIVAFAEGSGNTLPQACQLACGAAEGGSSCTVISGGNAALASFAAETSKSSTAFIAKVGDQTEIRLFSGNGMPFSREELRKLSSKKPQKAKITGSVYLLPHGALVKKYLGFLRERIRLPRKIKIADGYENRLLKEIADELEIGTCENCPTFRLSADGERVSAILPNGKELSFWQLLTICCVEGNRNSIVLPRDTPNTVEQILKRHSIDVKFYGDSDSWERKLAKRERLHRDGIFLALTAAGIAEKIGLSLESLSEHIPAFSITSRSICADPEKMYSVIAKLRDGCGNSRCVGFDFGEGRVSVYAGASGRFKIIAEAVDSETAEEIALRAIDKLQQG